MAFCRQLHHRAGAPLGTQAAEHSKLQVIDAEFADGRHRPRATRALPAGDGERR